MVGISIRTHHRPYTTHEIERWMILEYRCHCNIGASCCLNCSHCSWCCYCCWPYSWLCFYRNRRIGTLVMFCLTDGVPLLHFVCCYATYRSTETHSFHVYNFVSMIARRENFKYLSLSVFFCSLNSLRHADNLRNAITSFFRIESIAHLITFCIPPWQTYNIIFVIYTF